MNKNLFYIYLSIFLVYVGFGLTLPVLPFFVERMSTAGELNRESVSIHVGLITGVFAFVQIFFSPLWGKLSDKIGRKPLFSIGLTGTAISIFLFGISYNLAWLYVSRVIGGIFSAAVMPVAGAYASDLTHAENRGRVLAWINGASSLGVTVGPAAALFLININVPNVLTGWNFTFNKFSVPFTALSFLIGFNLFLIRRLPKPSNNGNVLRSTIKKFEINNLVKKIKFLLILSIASQYSLMIFEAAFSLHSKYNLNYGPFELGIIFSICGGIMGLAQILFIGNLIAQKGEKFLLPVGFLLAAIGILALIIADNFNLILLSVLILSVGLSSISPSLSSLITKQVPQNIGAALGVQSSFDNIGKSSGAFLGGALFALNIHIPFLTAGLFLLLISLGLFRKNYYSRSTLPF